MTITTHTPNSWPEVYEAVLKRVMRASEHQVDPRGQATREILDLRFTLDAAKDNGLFQNKVQSTDLRYLAGELVWYFTGRNDVAFIRNYSTFWDAIAQNGLCESAYGRLLFRQNRWGATAEDTEWKWAHDKLQRDPQTRQAIMTFHRPEHHYEGNKDVPCTLNAAFLYRNQRLDMRVYMRSSDVYFGLPFDVPFFLLLQQAMAMLLGVEVGHYQHTAISTHMYERNADKIAKMLEHPFLPVSMPRPDNPLVDEAGNPVVWLRMLEQDAVQPITSRSYVEYGDFASWLAFHALSPKKQLPIQEQKVGVK